MSSFNSSIERARAVSLLSVTAKRGLKLAKRKKEYIGACPHCGGCSASRSISTRRCFSAAAATRAAAVRSTSKSSSAGAARQRSKPSPARRCLQPTRHGPAAAQRRAQEKEKPKASKTRTLAMGPTARRRRGPSSNAISPHVATPGVIPATIAYLPARGEYEPAMVSAYALPSELDDELRAPRGDEVHAVHLTRLLPDGSDGRRDAHAKITIGAPLGYPIAIAPITDGMSLCLTEGIEDALAYRAAGFGAWAAGFVELHRGRTRRDYSTARNPARQRHPRRSLLHRCRQAPRRPARCLVSAGSDHPGGVVMMTVARSATPLTFSRGRRRGLAGTAWTRT